MKRTCKVLLDNEWKEIPFDNLRKQDIFKLYENNTPIDDDSTFKALSNPYLNKDGILTIDCNVI